MKTWQLTGVLGLAGVLGGAVGGFLVGRADGGDSTTRKPTTLRDAVEAGPEAAEEAEEDPEVEALRGRIASLERRISLLTAAMARGQASAPGAEGEAPGTNPREADVADPVFEAAVLDIMDRERERADGERETRRAELRTERRQRISDGLATNLGLDEPQKARVGELISAHFDSMRALRSDDNPERPVTPREWREKAAELERVLQQGLAEVLTPKQLAAYQALDPDDQIGGSFGRPRSRGEPRGDASAPTPSQPAR